MKCSKENVKFAKKKVNMRLMITKPLIKDDFEINVMQDVHLSKVFK